MRSPHQAAADRPGNGTRRGGQVTPTNDSHRHVRSFTGSILILRAGWRAVCCGCATPESSRTTSWTSALSSTRLGENEVLARVHSEEYLSFVSKLAKHQRRTATRTGTGTVAAAAAVTQPSQRETEAVEVLSSHQLSDRLHRLHELDLLARHAQSVLLRQHLHHRPQIGGEPP